MTKRLLVPIDGSKSTNQVLAVAARQAKALGAHVCLLYVVESPARIYSSGYAYGQLEDDTKKWGEEVLSSAQVEMKEHGVEDLETHLESGHPAQVILDYIKPHQIDQVVMGTHGRRGLDRLLLGSVAEEVVRCSPVPVLTVRVTKDAAST